MSMFFFRAKCVFIFIEIIEIEIWGILGIQIVNPKNRGRGYNYSEGCSHKVKNVSVPLLLRFKSVSKPFQIPFLDRTKIGTKRGMKRCALLYNSTTENTKERKTRMFREFRGRKEFGKKSLNILIYFTSRVLLRRVHLPDGVA